MQEYDLIVIGSGPGGYVGAIRASQLGLKTAVVEKSKTFGGTCLNIGCIPSKALLESSEHYVLAQHSLKEHGVNFKNVQLNLKEMMKRKDKVVSDLTNGIQFLFKKNKIQTYEGWGVLKSNTEVEVSSHSKKEIIKGKNILLATGSEASELPFAKWDSEVVLSSTEVLSLSSVPKKLIVIGGGYIGLELGSVWNRLGSEVTVIEYSSSICPSMDQDIGEKLLATLKKQGLNFHLDSQVTAVEVKNKTAKVQWTTQGNKTHTLKSDKVLICVGRKAFTKNLGLENVNLKPNALGQLEINKNLQTSVPNIFAIGDLIPGPMLAHKAEEEGVAVAEFIVTGWSHVNYDTVPGVIYTWPEAAGVGKTEQKLIHQNISYNSGSFPFLANGRARSIGNTEGFVKVLAHKTTDKILGVHILGPRAGDLIAEAVVAMEFHASSEDLARSFHAHPTLSEALREASLAVHKRVRQM